MKNANLSYRIVFCYAARHPELVSGSPGRFSRLPGDAEMNSACGEWVLFALQL
jgi:hypothetical protein